MTVRQWLWVIGFVAVGLLAPRRLFGQVGMSEQRALELRNESHAPIPGRSTDEEDPVAAFNRHRAQADRETQAKTLYKDILKDPLHYLQKENEGALRELAEAIKNGDLPLDANDPLLRELKKVAEGKGLDGQGDLSPELKKLVEELRPASPANPGAESGPEAQSPESTATSPGASERARPESVVVQTQTVDPWEWFLSPEELGRSPLGPWLLRQIETLARDETVFRDSETVREAIAELRRYRETSLGSSGGAAGGWTGALSKWMRQALPRNGSESVWSRLEGLRSSGSSWADWISARPRSEPGEGRRAAGEHSRSLLDGDPGWMGLVGLGLAAVVLWVVVSRYGPGRLGLGVIKPKGGRAVRQWDLGEWPVLPRAVSSREDLVRAFEYLSLLHLGPEARMWNHRDIAARLGGEREDRRASAVELAALYEQARYAPDIDSLGGSAIENARHDLSLLAEVSPA